MINNDLSPDLLAFLRAALWGDAISFYRALSDDKQRNLLKECREQALSTLFYYYLHDELNQSLAEELQKKYQQYSINMLKNKVAFTALEDIFERNQIRYAPFKGMDLAYRCYPAPALRYLSDWDVLIHYEDTSRALKILQENMWSPQGEVNLKTMHHHYVQHFKGGYCLEPHWTFARFGNTAPEKLWEHIHPVNPGRMRHQLSAELNLLQLNCHAASWLYGHLRVSKLLLDVGFLLKTETVDFRQIRSLCKDWHLPYPGNLLGAYPEFFLYEKTAEPFFVPEAARNYRKLVSSKWDMESLAGGEFDLNDESGGYWRGIRRALNRMSCVKMREKYHLPEYGCRGRLLVLYGYDLILKSGRLLKCFLRPDSRIRYRRKLITKAGMLPDE